MYTRKLAVAVVQWIAVAFAGSVGAAEPASTLVGAWTYLREVDTRMDGSPAPIPAPAEASGSLIYTADGYVSVIVTPKSAAWSLETVSLPDLQAAVAGTTAYSGRYEVDAAAGTVIHLVEVSLEPEYVGKRLVRQFRLRDDTLELSGSFTDGGIELRFTL